MKSKRKTKTVEVRFTPDDNGTWLVESIDEPRVHSYGRTIESAKANMADALALWYETAADDFEIVPRFGFPKRLLALVETTRRMRDEARAIEDQLNEKTALAVEQLTARGVSRRDAATLLGISHQRVQQILDRAAS